MRNIPVSKMKPNGLKIIRYLLRQYLGNISGKIWCGIPTVRTGRSRGQSKTDIYMKKRSKGKSVALIQC